MIVIIVIAWVVAAWSLLDTIAAAFTDVGGDPAIYLRVGLLAALVAIGLTIV